jgi:hypothetical protein
MNQFLSVYYFSLLLLHVSATVCHSQGARLYLLSYMSICLRSMLLCPAERICAQLDKATHETTRSGAHRPPTNMSKGVHPDDTTISDFQVTHKDKGRSLKIVHKCRNT